MDDKKFDYISKCSTEIIEFIKNVRSQTGFDYAYINLKVINNLVKNGILIEVIPKVENDNIDSNVFGKYFFPIKTREMLSFMDQFADDFNNTNKRCYLVERIWGSEKYWFDCEINNLKANSLVRRKQNL